MEKDISVKNWFKRHSDTLVVLLTLVAGWYGLFNPKFESIDKKFEKIDNRLASLEKDVTIIKTVLISKGYLNSEYFTKNEK